MDMEAKTKLKRRGKVTVVAILRIKVRITRPHLI